jgi:hypothetical protein
VDLDSGAVTRLDVPDGYPMPIVPEEIQEAARVARANDDVRDALVDAGLDPASADATGLLTGTADAESPCATHRCLRLFFTSLDRPVPQFSVVVDLVALEVIEVQSFPGAPDAPVGAGGDQ